MKKILLIPIFLTLTILIFSCKKTVNSQVDETKYNPSAVSFDKQKLLILLHGSSAAKGISDDETFMANLSENLDSIGAWHNEFLDYIFTHTVQKDLSMCDKPGYKNYNTWGKDFYESKGIHFNEDFVDFYVEHKIENQPVYPRIELSESANSILYLLDKYIDESDKIELEQFIENCDDLKATCISTLVKDNEKVAVGTAISVAKYSAQYWHKNFDTWNNYYSSMVCSPKYNYSGKMSPTEKKVLQADTGGAISGAIGGGIGGGLVGIVAGAVLVGGWSSCVSAICIGFKIDHITDWLW